ncbi:hypothetical protein [Nocardioides massiliensis]|uniref:Uncharacterized protein n=1 Tax=Nocardioides massiliensis TaxID=1325935 RepID=A0ABT9NQS9_9ACTN|nr:hypothetical protein [Nocardioides massiliensis]MDP9822788.1 hypothetical protein [Nocardioides massiliensis]
MTSAIDEKHRMIFCPTWCSAEPHEHDFAIESETGRPVMSHTGPMFGPFFTSANTHVDTLPDLQAVNAEVRAFDLDDVAMTPESLRQLAAEALDAAEWLEANR